MKRRELISTNSIFIHAMWRTGSTFIWKKFRDQPKYYAFYEPFNEALLTLNESDRKSPDYDTIQKLIHPQLDRNYFSEYPLKAEGGVPGLTSSLCYRRYCLDQDSDDQELGNYLQRLISEAESHVRQPVFKFNRSLLRTAWIKRRFSGTHLLLLRDPRDVWASFQTTASYFSGAVCQIVGQNSDHRRIQPIATHWKIPHVEHENIYTELNFYKSFAQDLGDKMYGVFHAFYMLTFIYNFMHADIIIDIDLVSAQVNIRHEIEAQLEKFGMSLSLADCAAPRGFAMYGFDVNDIEQENLRLLRNQVFPEIRLSRSVLTSHAETLSSVFQRTIEGYVI